MSLLDSLRNSEPRFKDFSTPEERIALVRSAVAVDPMERAGVGKTIKITVETETLTIIRRAKAAMAWCPDCCADVEVITFGADMLAESIGNSRLRTWRASGRLHFWQPAVGPAQICVPSLLQCFEQVQILGTPE